MKKEIHIVFQVLNFIAGQESAPYTLSASEQMLLIMLTKHKGTKGIYPSITTLAKELKRSRRSVQYDLESLQAKKLIKIDQIPGKSNQYSISEVIHTHATDCTPPMQPSAYTHATGCTQSDNKKKTDKENREGALSFSFHPKPHHHELAKQRGIDVHFVLNKYLDNCRSNNKQPSDANFTGWLEREKRKGTPRNPNEPRCTVPEYGPGHPRWEALYGLNGIRTKQ